MNIRYKNCGGFTPLEGVDCFNLQNAGNFLKALISDNLQYIIYNTLWLEIMMGIKFKSH